MKKLHTNITTNMSRKETVIQFIKTVAIIAALIMLTIVAIELYLILIKIE